MLWGKDMNKIYKIVWNKTLAQMVVVSENAKSAGKSNTTTGTILDNSLSKSGHYSDQSKNSVFAQSLFVFKSLCWSIALVSGVTWAGVADNTLPTGVQVTQG